MDYTIQELRALHKLSKPEMKKAMDKTNELLKSEPMSRKVRVALDALSVAVKSYDEVIDTLFAEIDMLNGMKETV